MLCADLVEVRWKDESGRNCKAEAVLEDISASGACLQLEKPVPLDAVVYWRSGKKKFRGEVRYCRYLDIGYFVGLRFDPASRWSKKMFKPRHLLDLERLMADSK